MPKVALQPGSGRGHKSIGLNRQGGKKGRELPTDLGRARARAILNRPKYLKSLQTRADEGKLNPAVEALLWHYGYGKPREVVEVPKVPNVTIVFTQRQNATPTPPVGYIDAKTD